MRRGAWFSLVWTLAGCFVAPGHRRARGPRRARAVRFDEAEREVFVQNVPRSLDERALGDELARFGPVANVWLAPP